MERREVLITGLGGLVAITAAPAFAATRRRGVSCEAAFRLLSVTRRTDGLTDLETDPGLAEMAWRHAGHMADTGQASHLGPDGGDPVARARQVGFTGRVLGETLAETFDSPVETMRVWLSQAATRDVLMDPDAHACGLAAATGQDGRLWLSLATGA